MYHNQHVVKLQHQDNNVYGILDVKNIQNNILLHVIHLV